MYFLFISLILALAACSSPLVQPQPEIVTIVLQPTASQVQDCKVSLPPKSADYVYASASDKEALLYDYSAALLNDLAQCNSQWRFFRKWHTEQTGIFQK